MQATQDHGAPPEWWVSNGTRTVGPVGTELLLRGVLHGRVPRGSWVRQTAWHSWREIDEIREVSALKRVTERRFDDLPRPPATLRESAASLDYANDAGEAVLLALHAAARATSASAALAYRVRAPLFLPTISCVFDVPITRLGEVLPWFDAALSQARTGDTRLIAARGEPGTVERSVNDRLGTPAPLAGIAIVPVMVHAEVQAVLELGRSDHAFRSSDLAELSGFAQHLALTLQRLQARCV